MSEVLSAAPGTCGRCGTQIAPSMLSCPACHQLVHAERLKELAAEAQAAEQRGDDAAARDRWRDALALLPPGSAQYGTVGRKVTELSQRAGSISKASEEAKRSWLGKRGAIGAALAALLFKLKWVILLVLSQGKLLLLGLTKIPTLLSMLLFARVLWTGSGGWVLAVGLTLAIYVHEMGHVVALQRYGVRATAPMFVPGLGALVLLKEHFSDVRQDARVGLAGPLWGLGASLGAYGIHLATHAESWRALAAINALINLFNLLPFWQLDGGRAFHSLTRAQRAAAVVVLLLLFALTRQKLLLLLAALGAYQAASGGARERDDGALGLYAGLAAALAVLGGLLLRVAG